MNDNNGMVDDDFFYQEVDPIYQQPIEEADDHKQDSKSTEGHNQKFAQKNLDGEEQKTLDDMEGDFEPNYNGNQEDDDFFYEDVNGNPE